MNNKELTKKIFLCILGVAGLGLMLTMAVMAPNCVQLLKVFDIDRKRKREIQKIIYRLKKQKLVRIYFKGNEKVIEITGQGKKRVLKYNFEEMKIEVPQKWDGLWRIIIFDIPINKKAARDALRTKLRLLDFVQLQKSVFLHPFPCKNEIDFIAEFFNVKNFINYIEAIKIDEEKKYKKHFKL